MKRKCLVVVILLLLVGTSNILVIAKNSFNLEVEKEPVGLGKIYGCVGNSHGMFTWTPCPFALVTTGAKQVICGLDGQYSMSLSLYYEYNVTANVIGFKPLTKHIYLGAEESNKELNFDMCGCELVDSKPFEKSSIRYITHETYIIKNRVKDIYENNLDPGWIRGPIWGRIDGYEFRGTEKVTLVFYAKNVHYFGIGHAFNSGLYPRHWVNKEITAWYSYFDGIITEYLIFGRIYGLPDQ